MHTYPIIYYSSFLLFLLCKIILHASDGWMRPNKQSEPSLMELLRLYEQKHERMRKLVLPQEVKHRLTKWCGGYRWFESENVVCLEKARWVRAKRSAG
jgi:hypothetical protein